MKPEYENNSTHIASQSMTRLTNPLARASHFKGLRSTVFRLKKSAQAVLTGALICVMLLSALPQWSQAQGRPDDGAIRGLLLLLEEAQEAARDRSVKDSLKGIRRLLEDLRDRQRQGNEEIAVADFSRAHDTLRNLIDAPRGESAELQEKLANALKALEEVMGQGGGGPHLALTETAFGLHTATFDTLEGTVTVNLPDDLAAGDSISGTVIAEAKGETAEQRQQNQDQLNGLVVEFDKQPTPAGQQVAKWAVPAGLAAVPLILKSRTGKEVGRAQIPTPQEPFRQKPVEPEIGKKPGKEIAKQTPGKPTVNPDQNKYPQSIDVPQGYYQTPALAQAGKPVEVKGKFDGDLQSTAVSIANRAVKVLAESPRKVIAQSPAGVVGAAQIEVKKRGVTVAKCVYRSLGIRLSAAKLNLLRGEQTTMTVTVLGLDNPSSNNVEGESAARVHLMNRSPWVVQMEGGQSQSFSFSPTQGKNGTYTTTRTLTGIKAGNFAINATVEPVASKGQCQSAPPPDANYPRPGIDRPDQGAATSSITPGAAGSARPVTQPTGQTDPDIDSNGNPRSSTGTRPVDPFRGSFRVTLNGFRCNRQTYDDRLERDGVGDEVTLINHIGIVDRSGRLQRLSWGNVFSSFMGQRPRNEIQAGTGSDRGGLVTNDGFPTPTPWIRSAALNPNIPPNTLFEGELIDGTNAAVILPTIWEVDGPSALQTTYADAIDRDTPNLIRSVVGNLDSRSTASFLRPGSALGIGNTVRLGHGPLGLGEVNNRPIGMQALADEFGFTPQALVLTYGLALLAERSDVGFGRGVIPVRYLDDRRLEGDYTLFIKVERLDSGRSSSPECTNLTATFTGEAMMTVVNPNTPNPFRQAIRLGIEFSECRTIVRVVDFPPTSTPPFDTPLGRNTTTVTLTSGGSGSYDPASGRLDINATLHFEHSLRSPLAGASDLTISLSTSAAGGRPIRMGRGALAGTATFRGGFLNGSRATLVIDGELSPNP